jgi:microcystin-dependent protein
MGTGNDNNNWGDLANASIFQIFEDAIANVLPGPTGMVTGGTLDLSTNAPPAGPSQARYMHLRFTGALGSNQTIIVPNRNKLWLVSNATSGPHSLFIQVAGGNIIQVPQNAVGMVSVNAAATTVFRLDASEVGKVVDFAGTAAPPGYLECDGSLLARADYPDLFAAIGTTWDNSVDGTHFRLPDMKTAGRYRRSRTGSATVGTLQADQFLSHTHSVQSSSLNGGTDAANPSHSHGTGNLKGDTGGAGQIGSGTLSQRHTHTMNYSLSGFAPGANSAIVALGSGPGSGTSGNDTPDHVHNLDWSGKGTDAANISHSHGLSSVTVNMTLNNTGGAGETRPISAVFLTCIRY